MIKNPNMQIFLVKRCATTANVPCHPALPSSTWSRAQTQPSTLQSSSRWSKKRETFKTHLEKGIIEISCNIPRFVIIGSTWHLFYDDALHLSLLPFLSSWLLLLILVVDVQTFLQGLSYSLETTLKNCRNPASPRDNTCQFFRVDFLM